MSDEQSERWWRTAVLYEIYVRSFQDSNGDGVGDLEGIRLRLDDLEWLGVDAIWLTPIYPSPMADFGYDISDHCDVHPLFGSMADFDRLLADVHGRGMKLILDFVPNHTSDEHPWFQESRSSRNSPKRDWYIWQDPSPDGGPPNNWLSSFGGSAWQFDETTRQYYYHAFLGEQPGLNWRNPELRAAMYDVLRFWLGRGVDGFRVDAVDHLLEDARLRDDPPNPRYSPQDPPTKRLSPVFSQNQTQTRDLCGEMGRLVRESRGRVLIGEVHVPAGQLISYYSGGDAGLDLPFNFALITTPWRSADLREAIDSYVARLSEQEWPNWVLSNHDEDRVASRVGRPQARVAAMFLLTLRGTPTLYYGDEIGMRNVTIPPEQALDPRGRLLGQYGLNRDPARTPMQWDSGPNAGFTPGHPWLPVAEDYREFNVEAERDDPGSMLSLYRRLIELRRAEPAIREGEYTPRDTPDGTIAYVRSNADRTFLVATNLGQEAVELELGPDFTRGRVRLSTHLDREGETAAGRLRLRADEAVILQAPD